ncbi:MAG TPA: heme o synthase [Candidatus Saccharimonadales bacterium]|nr:heme o synthase [Candidatus Saccharimonadales bacterium]
MGDVATDAAALPRARKYTSGETLRAYYHLTKPGIIYSNAMTAVSGYIFASLWHVQPLVLLSLVAGTMLLIASACVLNNYIDRPLDRRMKRTQKRALVTGAVSGRSALLFALALGVLGFVVLRGTNALTVVIGLLAVFSYVVLYGLAKRYSVHGTLVGTLPGAASLVAGYTAVTGRLDLTALLLCLVMVAWQMPHFYAIAVRRLDDYKNAGLPVWPVRYGIQSAARQVAVYIMVFMAAGLLLTLTGHEGVIFAAGILCLGVLWLRRAWRGLRTHNDHWARETFLFSLIALVVLAMLLPLGVLLP